MLTIWFHADVIYRLDSWHLVKLFTIRDKCARICNWKNELQPAEWSRLHENLVSSRFKKWDRLKLMLVISLQWSVWLICNTSVCLCECMYRCIQNKCRNYLLRYLCKSMPRDHDLLGSEASCCSLHVFRLINSASGVVDIMIL